MKIIKNPSPTYSERTLRIDSIIIHYTDMSSAEEALAWLSNPISQVSAHYLIDQTGQIFQLVDEDKRAWHAGESYWQGCIDLNSCSIGIELDNPGLEYGYKPFPLAQTHALMELCKEICKRWDIPPSRILGHSDIAPRRKQDPGHLFPWDELAQEGLGLWPSGSRKFMLPGLLSPRPSSILNSFNQEKLMAMLSQVGYETISPSDTVLAFQRHFQPHKVDGIADDETLSLLRNLL